MSNTTNIAHQPVRELEALPEAWKDKFRRVLAGKFGTFSADSLRHSYNEWRAWEDWLRSAGLKKMEKKHQKEVVTVALPLSNSFNRILLMVFLTLHTPHARNYGSEGTDFLIRARHQRMPPPV